jgi:hypothetical protein
LRSSRKSRCPDHAALRTVCVCEYGVRFMTGLPVEFIFVRGTTPAGYYGASFQQDIEPAGRYMLHNPEPGDLPAGWITGTVAFASPLVLAFHDVPDEVRYDDGSWKWRLHRAFDGARGRVLSRRLRACGYDGIVTADSPRGQQWGTREIVAL